MIQKPNLQEQLFNFAVGVVCLGLSGSAVAIPTYAVYLALTADSRMAKRTEELVAELSDIEVLRYVAAMEAQAGQDLDNMMVYEKDYNKAYEARREKNVNREKFYLAIKARADEIRKDKFSAALKECTGYEIVEFNEVLRRYLSFPIGRTNNTEDCKTIAKIEGMITKAIDSTELPTYCVSSGDMIAFRNAVQETIDSWEKSDESGYYPDLIIPSKEMLTKDRKRLKERLHRLTDDQLNSEIIVVSTLVRNITESLRSQRRDHYDVESFLKAAEGKPEATVIKYILRDGFRPNAEYLKELDQEKARRVIEKNKQASNRYHQGTAPAQFQMVARQGNFGQVYSQAGSSLQGQANHYNTGVKEASMAAKARSKKCYC